MGAPKRDGDQPTAYRPAPDLAGGIAGDVFQRTPAPTRKDGAGNPLEDIDDGFRMIEPDPVKAFLNAHFGLPDAILTVRGLIADKFPASVPTLRLVRDREGSGSADLFIIIPTTLPRLEARGRLNQIDRSWHENLPDELRRLVYLDLKFL